MDRPTLDSPAAVVAVAVVSIATAVVAILIEPDYATAGVPGAVQATTAFSAAIVGFALLVAAWGLRRGYHLAYLAAVALTILAAVHGVTHLRVLSVPLVVVALAGTVVLVRSGRRFARRPSPTPTQIGATLAVGGVFAYGVAGAYALREQFDGVEGGVDALYFAVVTASTVGYGDVHPTGEAARLFTVSLAILGPTAVGVVVGSVLAPTLEEWISDSHGAGRSGRGLRADGGCSPWTTGRGHRWPGERGRRWTGGRGRRRADIGSRRRRIRRRRPRCSPGRTETRGGDLRDR